MRLRTYLTALIIAPLLVCAGFGGLELVQRIDEAHAADRTAELVQDAAALERVQADLQGELLSASAYAAVTTPALHRAAGLRGVAPAELGLTTSSIARQRRQTDAALDAASARPGVRSRLRALPATLRRARADIDAAVRLPAGYDALVAAGTSLGLGARRLMSDAVANASARALSQALRDSALVGEATQAGTGELALLAADRFPGLGARETRAAARTAWLRSWAAFETASDAVLARTGTRTAALWRRAMARPGTARLQAQFAAFAGDATHPLALAGVLAMYRAHIARTTDLGRVETATVRSAVRAATALRSSAYLMATLVAALVLLVVGMSVGIGIFVRRAIARPLQSLSRTAEHVGRGELVDVRADGPREIRTVADGLSAAVASLRRIEAQAAAVAAGDLDATIVRTPLPGALGAVMHSSVATIVDAIHERDLARSDLQYQATHDGLTGLPNRTQAMLAIRRALQRARRVGALTALIYVDLDHFKAVNDSHGHGVGDAVLRASSERMVAVIRDADSVFRLGGDEFVILVEDATPDFAFVALAERLVEAISLPVAIDGRTARIGASLGISVCQDASVDAEKLLSQADAAAYSAKAAGRGRVGIFDEALRHSLDRRALLERELEHALADEHFELHYQPVVEMSTSRPIGFEALIRWHHPVHGLLSPDEFIPVAEKSMLINRIGRWTLHEATAQLARWDAEGAHPHPLTMAVNVSGRHLASRDLVFDVRAALDASGIDPSRLVVEITETVLVDDPIALDNMHTLRAMGVCMAIDDFGTGYTSIGQLPKLPVDMLKIDRSFTGSDESAHHQLVRLIVEAAHAFGLTVVAEGIEGQAQAFALHGLNVDTGQGFFFARPQPAGRARELATLDTLPPGAAAEIVA
ncbi:diguanylate cyclase (GGDEF) domain-containing protein [Jatrophihabitans endophyticus]|uniref:Diguanylate cyclase (GGDEF) domain-containing protein n=1 Tax=Jatrophihabitans endophyticus TaxID=1206085 RepID=A0A1M5CCW3_9ACTN|nr:sensor domain-containing phosphodiesterase [Jatrophihabitans endophyticus]SHF52551.1 diguanylate cyclase (GGDEF) domain-containing protein [Jatrophihabitans endophyticus]